MCDTLIVYTRAWPLQVALKSYLLHHDPQVRFIYRDIKTLLFCLHEHPQTPLIIECTPHQDVLLLLIIRSLSLRRHITLISLRPLFSDRAIAAWLGQCCCLGYNDILRTPPQALYAPAASPGADASPGQAAASLHPPRLKHIIGQRQALCRALQNSLHQQMFLAGATPREVAAMRMLNNGMSVNGVARAFGVGIKAVYNYRLNLISRLEGETPTRNLQRALCINQAIQNDGWLMALYQTRCSRAGGCVACPFNSLCYRNKKRS